MQETKATTQLPPPSWNRSTENRTEELHGFHHKKRLAKSVNELAD